MNVINANDLVLSSFIKANSSINFNYPFYYFSLHSFLFFRQTQNKKEDNFLPKLRDNQGQKKLKPIVNF